MYIKTAASVVLMFVLTGCGDSTPNTSDAERVASSPTTLKL